MNSGASPIQRSSSENYSRGRGRTQTARPDSNAPTLFWREKSISRDLILQRNEKRGGGGPSVYPLSLLPLVQSVGSLVRGPGLLSSEMRRRQRGSSWRLRRPCFAAPGAARRRDRDTAVEAGRVGIGVVGEVVARSLRPLRPWVPDSAVLGTARNVPVLPDQDSRAPGGRGSPRGRAPSSAPGGSASSPPAGRGSPAKMSVSAAGLLRCGGRTGRSPPGREAAEPGPQSWRCGRVGAPPRASSPVHLSPSGGGGIWKPRRV